MDGIFENILIKRVKEKGDRAAASELIKYYYEDIYRYVFKQVSDGEYSKDLTQEIFISMLKSIGNYDDNKSSFKTWLYKISSNKIIDYYRSKYYKYISIVDDIENYDFLDTFDIERDFELREDVNKVMCIVNKLPSNIQQIFRLKIFADMTFSDIASLLDISESTVKTRYYSVIRKVKKVMEEGESNGA